MQETIKNRRIKKMNKKISITFAIAVIVLIAGTLTFIFLNIAKDLGLNADVKCTYCKGGKEIEKPVCSKHAFDGEIKINGWYVDEGESWVLQISNDDLKKLPAGYRDSKVILADGSDSLVAKLKKSSEKSPTEITIKGFYSGCDGIPMVSVAPGEEVFKKYLTQK